MHMGVMSQGRLFLSIYLFLFLNALTHTVDLDFIYCCSHISVTIPPCIKADFLQNPKKK